MAVGFRDQAEQHQAKVNRKSHQDWPNSKHNFTLYSHPYSKACDLFMLGADGQAYFLIDYYKSIWEYYLNNEKAFGKEDYVWGGAWRTLKDFDHFEIDD